MNSDDCLRDSSGLRLSSAGVSGRAGWARDLKRCGVILHAPQLIDSRKLSDDVRRRADTTGISSPAVHLADGKNSCGAAWATLRRWNPSTLRNAFLRCQTLNSYSLHSLNPELLCSPNQSAFAVHFLCHLCEHGQCGTDRPLHSNCRSDSKLAPRGTPPRTESLVSGIPFRQMRDSFHTRR